MMDKTVRLGTTELWQGSRRYSVYARIQWDGKRLSITGVEGPRKDGNAAGGCGQICVSYRTAQERATIKPAPGWTHDKIVRFFDVWERWHLNNMRAGTPEQMAWLWTHQPEKAPKDYYEWASEALAAAGLNPVPYNRDGVNIEYRYGAMWLREDVPGDVIEWLEGLPDTDVEPAWV